MPLREMGVGDQLIVHTPIGATGALWRTPPRVVEPATPTVAIRAARPGSPHGAVPQGLGRATVATRTQRRPITLDRPGLEIRFIKRRVDDLDADLTTTVLGDVLVTSIEETILDLAHPACRGPRQKRTERRSSRSPEG